METWLKTDIFRPTWQSSISAVFGQVSTASSRTVVGDFLGTFPDLCRAGTSPQPSRPYLDNFLELPGAYPDRDSFLELKDRQKFQHFFGPITWTFLGLPLNLPGPIWTASWSFPAKSGLPIFALLSTHVKTRCPGWSFCCLKNSMSFSARAFLKPLVVLEADHSGELALAAF